jgi:ATP-dependent DNA helicase RecQ
LGRLRQVCDFAALDGCQSGMLAAHFGETLERPCGHCSGCNQAAVTGLERKPAEIPDHLAQPVAELVARSPQALNSPRALARLLCGVGSPRLSRARLNGHPLFGALAEVPFERVMGWVEAKAPLPDGLG